MALNPLLDGEEWNRERQVLAGWRSQFRDPLIATDMSLRSAVATVTGIPNGVGLVKQRFKREEQIIAKLVREKGRLSKMEDIGGCRAVLPDLATVGLVAARLEEHATALNVEAIDDYNAEPRAGGYRALHLHCLRDGLPIEVQLRTERQHAWAEAVEKWDGATGHDVKHESAPLDVLESFHLSAEMFAAADQQADTPLWTSMMRSRARDLLERWIKEHARGSGDG